MRSQGKYNFLIIKEFNNFLKLLICERSLVQPLTAKQFFRRVQFGNYIGDYIADYSAHAG
jgi:hypothetical protein